MNKVDKILSCVCCEEILKEPVLLPCGHSICKEHQEKLNIYRREKKIICKSCGLFHNIPKDGFPRNIMAEHLLESELYNINLGDEYNAALKKCSELEELVDELRLVERDPDYQIIQVIDVFKNRVDLKREEMKKKIDDQALALISKLNEFENECKINLDIYKLQRLLKKAETDLKRWNRDLALFKIDASKWKEIGDLSQLLKIELIKFKNELFCNKLDDYKLIDFNFCEDLYDPIKKIEFKLNNVSQYRNLPQDYDQIVRSEVDKEFGIEWQLSVKFQHSNAIGVFLKVNYDQINYDLYVEFEIAVLNQIKLQFEYLRRFGYTFDNEDNNSWGNEDIKHLTDITNNSNFYNAENDSFTIRANIYKIKWVEVDIC